MPLDRTPEARNAATHWMKPADCRIEEFIALIDRQTDRADYPLASAIERNVPVYDGDAARRDAADPIARQALMDEWVSVMLDGPGIIVLKRAFDDPAPLDRTSALFRTIITEQHAAGGAHGDHFAKPGANDRIWNALEKHGLRDPEGFAAYYGNPLIALVSEAWLGPCYQMTAQANVVNPGGAAQSAHRDYHLGFQEAEVVARYPAHVHRLSPVLTLQGAVAHCDMPVESGPTLYLPFSQTYLPGYLAWRLPEFRDYFDRHHVQLPLEKGDAVFFNPALFHAAGHNRTSTIYRMANLLQVSSAYGRAMESVDRTRLSARVYPAILDGLRAGRLSPAEADNAIAAAAEGYSFPTNLDSDPPVGGLAPQTQQALMRHAVAEGWAAARFEEALGEQAARRLA